MWRSIGSVTFLALLMAGCGGGSGGSGGGGSLPSYSIGGTVTGLTGSGLLLQTNAGDVAAVSAPGAFTFTRKLGSGAAFRVFVKTQPSSPTQNCVVTSGTGFVGTANVTTVAVTCTSSDTSYTIHGTVSGLVGSGLTLEICPVIGHGPGGGYGFPLHLPPCHSGIQIDANGAFTLDYVVPATYSGSVYVSITQQPASPWQQCRISNTTFPIQSASDTSVTVGCARFAYVTNTADNTLSAYSVDPVTGALTAIGTPTVAGVSPDAIVGVQYPFGEDKSYVFVGNGGSNDVSALAVNTATGTLTAIPGSPFPAGIHPQAMTLWGDGLFVANSGSDNVSAYVIDGSGALTVPPGSPIAAGKSPTSIVAGDQFIFVANHGGSNDISAFAADETMTPDGSIQISLTPVPGSPFPAGGNPLSLAIGAGKFLYSANPDATNPSISGFSINPATGALSPLSGSPFPLPVSQYIATDQYGAYLYVTSGATIVGYAIDASTGALTALPGFPVAAGANAYSMAVDPTNQFLYVANDGAANVSGFKLDASTGALTPMTGSPFPAGHHPDFSMSTF